MVYLVRQATPATSEPGAATTPCGRCQPAGHRQAAGLLVRLRVEPVARIVSSPALRCQQTVWPLAAQRRLRVDLDPRLDVDATADQAAAPLLAPALDDAVLCTNGELIGQLLGPDRSR